jgi:hypothetical protein
VSGINANVLRGELPRHDSPCGFVLEQREPHLFADPARHYQAMQVFDPPITELLAVPALDRHGDAGPHPPLCCLHDCSKPRRSKSSLPSRVAPSLRELGVTLTNEERPWTYCGLPR